MVSGPPISLGDDARREGAAGKSRARRRARGQQEGLSRQALTRLQGRALVAGKCGCHRGGRARGESSADRSKVFPVDFDSSAIIDAAVQRRDVAQFGSAPALGAGCRRFESCHPDHSIARHVRPWLNG